MVTGEKLNRHCIVHIYRLPHSQSPVPQEPCVVCPCLELLAEAYLYPTATLGLKTLQSWYLHTSKENVRRGLSHRASLVAMQDWGNECLTSHKRPFLILTDAPRRPRDSTGAKGVHFHFDLLLSPT